MKPTPLFILSNAVYKKLPHAQKMHTNIVQCIIRENRRHSDYYIIGEHRRHSEYFFSIKNTRCIQFVVWAASIFLQFDGISFCNQQLEERVRRFINCFLQSFSKKMKDVVRTKDPKSTKKTRIAGSWICSYQWEVLVILTRIRKWNVNFVKNKIDKIFIFHTCPGKIRLTSA